VRILSAKHSDFFTESDTLSKNGIILSAKHINLPKEGMKLPKDGINLHMNHTNSHTKHTNLPLSRRAGEGGTRREAVEG
jgi:hypothetical protein